jgi:threonine dehydrogenase-like Zn-dependent dehydrogenase
MGQLDLSDGPGSRDHRQDRQDRPKVKKWKVGDTVGVGCFVDSDRTCEACKAGEEQYCESGPTLT